MASTSGFPSRHLETTKAGKPILARALQDYTGKGPQELSFRQDDYVWIIGKPEADWWIGRLGQVEGRIPSNLVRVYEE